MCLRRKCVDINQRFIIIFIPCTKFFTFLSFQNATSSVLLAVISLGKRGVQLKGVVVKQMASERAQFSAPLTCPIFGLVHLLLNNSHGPLLAIIVIHHVLIHLFKRSKDKEQVHYGIILYCCWTGVGGWARIPGVNFRRKRTKGNQCPSEMPSHYATIDYK